MSSHLTTFMCLICLFLIDNTLSAQGSPPPKTGIKTTVSTGGNTTSIGGGKREAQKTDDPEGKKETDYVLEVAPVCNWCSNINCPYYVESKGWERPVKFRESTYKRYLELKNSTVEFPIKPYILGKMPKTEKPPPGFKDVPITDPTFYPGEMTPFIWKKNFLQPGAIAKRRF